MERIALQTPLLQCCSLQEFEVVFQKLEGLPPDRRHVKM